MTRIVEATDRALTAFWESVAQSYPEAKTGDLAPDVVHRLGVVAQTTIEAWVDSNVPDPEVQAFVQAYISCVGNCRDPEVIAAIICKRSHDSDELYNRYGADYTTVMDSWLLWCAAREYKA